jgi:hypothetical protein
MYPNVAKLMTGIHKALVAIGPIAPLDTSSAGCVAYGQFIDDCGLIPAAYACGLEVGNTREILACYLDGCK